MEELETIQHWYLDLLRWMWVVIRFLLVELTFYCNMIWVANRWNVSKHMQSYCVFSSMKWSQQGIDTCGPTECLLAYVQYTAECPQSHPTAMNQPFCICGIGSVWFFSSMSLASNFSKFIVSALVRAIDDTDFSCSVAATMLCSRILLFFFWLEKRKAMCHLPHANKETEQLLQQPPLYPQGVYIECGQWCGFQTGIVHFLHWFSFNPDGL